MTGSRRISLVVTTINAPNPVLKALADGSTTHGWDFIAIGDTKSPPGFALDGCRFFDVPAQQASGLAYAQACPTRHYARKNIGYLLAIQGGSELIVETDDDNFPRDGFWAPRHRRDDDAVRIDESGWTNVYGYFTAARIWPRGLPLDAVTSAPPSLDGRPRGGADCPIQQGLADENPDVDALYRLLYPLPQNFRDDLSVALGRGAWCPFNSQNTTWWLEAFPLLYLPAYCSFRMTDIWRSFVAQRIAWEYGWNVLFHGPTVWQERNEHDLMRDFADEVPGYLNNRKIAQVLDALPLSSDREDIAENMRNCYRKLVEMNLVGDAELPLLDLWLADLNRIQHP